MASKQLNVLKTPLALFSKEPVTGFFRDGYCNTGPQDGGNHAIAAEVTEPFLSYSAAQGNNLRSIGLTGGCKWCLCVSRWREAMLAAEQGGKGLKKEDVPKVFLESTNESALQGVSLAELTKYAFKKDGARGEL